MSASREHTFATDIGMNDVFVTRSDAEQLIYFGRKPHFRMCKEIRFLDDGRCFFVDQWNGGNERKDIIRFEDIKSYGLKLLSDRIGKFAELEMGSCKGNDK